MVEHVEGKAPSEASFEVRLEEVMAPLEEIPCMIQLDAPQPGEVMVLIFGTESVVGGGCREDGSHANGAGDERVILDADEVQDGRVENGHGTNEEDRTGGRAVSF